MRNMRYSSRERNPNYEHTDEVVTVGEGLRGFKRLEGLYPQHAIPCSVEVNFCRSQAGGLNALIIVNGALDIAKIKGLKTAINRIEAGEVSDKKLIHLVNKVKTWCQRNPKNIRGFEVEGAEDIVQDQYVINKIFAECRDLLRVLLSESRQYRSRNIIFKSSSYRETLEEPRDIFYCKTSGDFNKLLQGINIWNNDVVSKRMLRLS